MEIKKPNDIFAAVVQQPDVTLYDLAKSDIIPSNTQLLSRDEYKPLPKVQKLFTGEDGKFNETLFNAAYDKAAALYTDLGEDEMLTKALEYDPNDFTAPINAKSIDIRPVITKDINPFKQLYSRSYINSIDESSLSLKELAQQGRVFDTETNTWRDKTPNDLGLFGTIFNDTLVYAQWDDDGEAVDPVSGRLTKHKKGEWKYDENGNLFVETLGDREIYGKQIVNPMDVITKEGSWFNKVDFMDSDGKNKSAIGTTMKLATEIAPFFIPGGGTIYGGFKMALGLAEVLPTFYKAGEALFFGSTKKGNETELWKAMNSTQGFLAKYTDRNISEAGSQSMWNFEQLGNLVSDVFSQIYEQRAAAGLSKLFYKQNDTEYLDKLAEQVNKSMSKAIMEEAGIRGEDVYKEIAEKAFQKSAAQKLLNSQQSALAKRLNLGYMALTQSADVFQEAKNGGYDDKSAGFAALLAASGQYALMANNQMGTWFLDKAVGYTENTSKAQINQVVKSLMGEVKQGVDLLGVDKAAGKAVLGNVFTKAKNNVIDLFTIPVVATEGKVLGENLFKHSIIEGVEEVTEQAAIDMAKGVLDIASSLGWTEKKGSFGGFQNVFSQRGLENYLANLVGGAIGGSLFELQHSISEGITKSTNYDIYSAVANGQTEELLKAIDSQKSRYGSTTLAPLGFDVNGKKVYLTNEGLSQADVIAQRAKEYVRHIDNMLNLEGLKDDDESLIQKTIMDELKIRDIKKTGVDKFILSDFRQLSEQLVTERTKLEGLKEQTNSKEYKEAKAKAEELRQSIAEMQEGTKSEYYHGLSLFSLSPELHRAFLSLSVDEYVKDKYNLDYYALSPEDQTKYKEEFDTIMDESKSDLKTKMKAMYSSFLKMNEVFGNSLANYDSDGYASIRSEFFKSLRDIESIGPNGEVIPNKLNLKDALARLGAVNKALKMAGFPGVTLDSQTDISLGKFLLEAGLIETIPNPTEKNAINAKRVQDLANYFGINPADYSEEDFQNEIINKTTQEFAVRNALLKLQQQVPNLNTLTATQYAEAVDSSQLTDSEKSAAFTLIKPLLDVWNTLDTRVEPNVYTTQYNNWQAELASETAKSAEEQNPELIADLNNKLSGPTPEEYSQEWTSLAKNYNILSNEQVPIKDFSTFNAINTEADKALRIGKPITPEQSEVIASMIDRIGMSTDIFDAKTMQGQIAEYLKEEDSAARQHRIQLAQSITDPAELQKALESFQEAFNQLPYFRLKGTQTIAISKQKINLEIASLFDKVIGKILTGVTVNPTTSVIDSNEFLISENNFMPTSSVESRMADIIGEEFKKILDTNNKVFTSDLDTIKQIAINDTELVNALISNIKANQRYTSEDEFLPTIHSSDEFIKFDTGEGVLFNPRRKLLIKYAKDLYDHQIPLDNEVIYELNKERDALEDMMSGVLGIAPTDADINDLDTIEEILENGIFKRNILYDKLREFQTQLFGKTNSKSIFDILKESINAFNDVVTPAEYRRTDLELLEIEKALYTIKAVRSVMAAMTSTDLGEDNLYGMNVSLNKALEKKQEAPIYKLLSSRATNVMLVDLKIVEDKLMYLQTLAKSNAGTLIDEDVKIKSAIVSGLLRQLLDKTDKLSLFNLTVGGHPIIGSDDLQKLDGIVDQELKLKTLEHIVYTNFHSNPLPLEEKLQNFFTPFLFNGKVEDARKIIESSMDSDLTASFKRLELKDWYIYLHSILASDSNNFYLEYKNNVKKELALPTDSDEVLNTKKAPLFTQQLALREKHAFDNNKFIMSHAISFLQPSIETRAKELVTSQNMSYIEAVKTAIKEVDSFALPNLFIIRGSGGTGKSSTLGNYSLKNMLSEQTFGKVVDIWAVAPTEDTLNTLQKDLGRDIDHTITNKTKDALLQTVLTSEGYTALKAAENLISKTSYKDVINLNIADASNKEESLDPDYFIVGEGDGAIYLTPKFFTDYLKKSDIDASPKVVIIDEMSKFNTMEWQILNKLAEPNTSADREYDNYYITLMGDELQNGVLLGETNFNMDNVFASFSIKLKSTIRARNNHKNNNNIILEKFVEQYRNSAQAGTKMSVTPILTYYEDMFLQGDKITSSLTEEDLRKLNPLKQIAVITDDGKLDATTEALLKKVFGEEKFKDIPVISNNNVLGREFDQVIVLANLEIPNRPKYFSAKNIYTLLSRAKEATLVIGKSPITITNEKAVNVEAITLNPSIVQKAIENRLEQLELLTKDTSRSNIKPKSNVIVDKEGEDTFDSEALAEEEAASPEQQTNVITEETTYEGNNLSAKESLSKNNALMYSFFNNTGVEGNILNDYLDYTIVDSPEKSMDPGYDINTGKQTAGKITWIELREQLRDSLTGTDFLAIENLDYTKETTVRQMLNEYVRFKNLLLFSSLSNTGVNTPTNLLGMSVDLDKRLLIKKLDKFSLSYQKHFPHDNYDPSKKIVVLGKYITINGNDVFITLAVLPDLTNKAVTDKINAKDLQKIYNKLDTVPELEVDPNAVWVYKGVQVPRSDQLRNGVKVKLATQLTNGIPLSEIPNVFPGAVVSSEVRVFKGGENSIPFIREEFEKYYTTPTTKSDDFYARFQFRPYVIVSFADQGNTKFEKLVVLQPRSRPLSQLMVDIEEINTSNKEYLDALKGEDITDQERIDAFIESKRHLEHLVSNYSSWKILFNFFKHVGDKTEIDNYVKLISGYNQYANQMGIRINTWMPFEKAISEIANYVIANGPTANYSDFYKQATNKEILANGKEVRDLKIINPMILMFKISQISGDAEFDILNDAWNKFVEDYSADVKNDIYYNPVIKSVGTEAGAHYGTLSSDQQRYYQMKYAIESNLLLFDFSTLLKSDNKKKKSQTNVKDTESNIAATGINKLASLDFLDVSGDTNSVIISITDGKLAINFSDARTPIITPLNITNILNAENPDLLLKTMDDAFISSLSSMEWYYDEDSEKIKSIQDDRLTLENYVQRIYNIGSYALLRNADNSIREYTPTATSNITLDKGTDIQSCAWV